MAIGKLELNPNYINPEHPNNKWADEPEHSVVIFQFDPYGIKKIIQSKWKESDEKSTDDLNLRWDFSDSVEPQKFDMTLIFSDLVDAQEAGGKAVLTEGDQAPASTQKSLEILEAMSLPIKANLLQHLVFSFVREVQLPVVPQKEARTAKVQQEMELRRTLDLFDAKDRDIDDDPGWKRWGVRFATHAKFKEKITGRGTRLKEVWHKPRPLLLHLFDFSPLECVIENLEIDILTIDTASGAPTAANAIVTLAEARMDEYKKIATDGLIVEEAEKIESINDLRNWDKRVKSGEIKQEALPRRELLELELYRTDPEKYSRILQRARSSGG